MEGERRQFLPDLPEIEVKGKMLEETRWWGSERKRSGRLVGAADTKKERAEWRGHQQKNLNILGLLKRKEWPQCHRVSSWQVRQSRCQNKKEQSCLSRSPDRNEGEG